MIDADNHSTQTASASIPALSARCTAFTQARLPRDEYALFPATASDQASNSVGIARHCPPVLNRQITTRYAP